jgi:prepilin peptidase CpaA
MTAPSFPIVVVSATCLACAIGDIRRFRVANAWTLTLLATGLIYHAFVGGWPGLGRSAAGAGFGFAALLVPYALGGMGAGDVKLLAGVGAWLGLPMTYDVLIAAALIGGVYALLLAAATGRFRETMAATRKLMVRGSRRAKVPVQEMVARADRGRLVPFAAMVAFGLFATVIRS